MDLLVPTSKLKIFGVLNIHLHHIPGVNTGASKVI